MLSTTVCLISPGDAADPVTHHALLRIGRVLADAGRDVSIAVAGGSDRAAGPSDPAVPVNPIPPISGFQASEAVLRSLAVLRHLRERPAGLVIAPESGGMAFHVALARRLGLAFQGTRLLMLCLGPRAMRAALDGRLPAGREDLALDHLERCSVAWADAAVSPCGTVFDWMEGEGWTMPECRSVLPPPFPEPEAGGVAPEPGKEILFVGDLRRADGLPLFVQALQRLAPERLGGWRVTLLGERGRDAWSWDPSAWLAQAMPAGLPWCIEARPDAGGLAARLSRPGAVVVLPACGPVPEAARICLAHGIPFIGLDLPALRALVPEERRAALAAPNPGALAAAIAAALREPTVPCPRQAAAFAAAGAWRDLIAGIPGPAGAAERRAAGSALSVVLVHRNRPALLAQALDGLRGQTLEGFEVVLVDDGSDQPDALAALDRLEPDFAGRGWRILRGPNRGLGGARNAGWRAARGRFVLFHDDDNIALPRQLETLLAAACHSGAAVLTSFFETFTGEEPDGDAGGPSRGVLAMLGGALSLGLFENCFGDAHALVRRDVLEALGGFSEHVGLGHEDWEFFARAAIAGHEILAVPEVLFRYRIAQDSMIRARPDVEPDYRRNLSAYEALVPEPVRAALQLGFADTHRLAAAADRLASVEATRHQAEAAAAAARGETAALLERLERTRRERDAAEAELLRIAAEARAMAGAVATSASFRALGRLRRLLGRPATDPPADLQPAGEEVARLLRLLDSAGWDATGPLRLLGRLLGRR
ncbi:glycosyltransferase [Roseomonas alkaliterrae]|uniref:Glycosyltransferase 2-like domain-containing protein n=1 Tax=Neoroseomonas alkaliterrae TaxID=1452450 RepID=A0A840XN41_9PROT|nr:glycosyltransferase [Neoroseomonas alkaliterrae]MBB5689326.1 hypothetical protein [Neoroseomonas alkaliterrae]MBR0678204.1 glycosyltransferase [Neoroseomonas alkaliterrae]